MPKIHVSFFSYVALFLILLYFDALTVVSIVLALIVHELGHIVFISAFGGKISLIDVSPFGLTIKRDRSFYHLAKELAVFTSGPLFSIAFFALTLFFGGTLTGQISLLYGLINLLPVKIFDGGKALYAILDHLCPMKANRIMNGINLCFILIIWAMSIFIMMKSGDYVSMFFLSIYLFIAIIQ